MRPLKIESSFFLQAGGALMTEFYHNLWDKRLGKLETVPRKLCEGGSIRPPAA